MKQRLLTMLAVFLLGGLAGYGISLLAPGEAHDMATMEKEPLYWVAPMDPNYRRDSPGKSPMGMDLVPVYEEQAAEDEPGTVAVSGTVQQQLALTTATVTRGVLPERLRASGLAVFNGNFLETYHSRVEGWITELKVAAAGDPVKKGDLLFRLYSPALVSAQQELLTALRSGQSSLVTAAAERLVALGVSTGTIDALKRRQSPSRDVPFYAGQDGVISELGVRRGSFVRPNDLVVAVGDPNTLWIEADLLERQAGLVEEGDAATLQFDALPGADYAGTVTYIYPQIDAATRSVRLRVVLDNADGRVMPGMFAHVDIHGGSAEPVLSVPVTALIRAPGDNRVVKQTGPGTFLTVPVRSGRESRDRVEILDGLEEGDEVVTSAQFLIDSESSRSGARLRLEGHDHD